MAKLAVSDRAAQEKGSAVAAAAGAAAAALLLGLILIEIAPRLVTAGFSVRAGIAASEAIIDIAIFAPLMAIATIGGRLQQVTVWRLGQAPGGGAAIGLIAGIAGLSLAALMVRFAGTIARGEPATGGAVLLLGIVVTLIQVAGEEVYVRGWLQPVMARASGPVAGAALAALVFTLLHLAGGARGTISLFNIFLAGFVFGLTATRTRGIVAPIAVHFGWNVAEQFLFGLDPNPGVGPFGALFNLDMTGSALWGGSEEGLNASVAVTVVMGAAALPLLAWKGLGAEPAPIAPEAQPEPPRAAARHAWLVGEG